MVSKVLLDYSFYLETLFLVFYQLNIILSIIAAYMIYRGLILSSENFENLKEQILVASVISLRPKLIAVADGSQICIECSEVK